MVEDEYGLIAMAGFTMGENVTSGSDEVESGRSIRERQERRDIHRLCGDLEERLALGNPPVLGDLVSSLQGTSRRKTLEELALVAAELLAELGEPDPRSRIKIANPALWHEIENCIPTLQLNLAGSKGQRERVFHVRCQHCHSKVQPSADSDIESILCTTCGKVFCLVDNSRTRTASAQVDRVAHFQMLSEVGVGSFGTVWKAHDTRLNRMVAVKIPRSGQFDAKQERDFLREAQNAAQLSHPAIVPVHEIGRDGDTLYIVSDLVRGLALNEWLVDQRLNAREAADLCAKIAAPLHHAHEQRVIHRDLKPGNIMIDLRGDIHLLDFGLSKIDSDVSIATITAEGKILGTPNYMSPEQAEGKVRSVDRRTDIYALGVIFFEMLTGELPFRGDWQAQLSQRAYEEAPSVRSLNHTVPKDVATICAKCLEYQPARRYDTAEEVRQELIAFLEKRPIQARPISNPERAMRWMQRKPVQATLVGLVVFLAIAGPVAALSIATLKSKVSSSAAERNRLIGDHINDDSQMTGELGQLQLKIDRLTGDVKPEIANALMSGDSSATVVMSEFLKASEPYLQLSTKDESLPAVHRLQALLTLAVLHDAIGGAEDAVQLSAAALALVRSLTDVSSDPSLLAELLDYHAALLAKLKDDSVSAPVGEQGMQACILESLKLRREVARSNPEDLSKQLALLETELKYLRLVGADDGRERITAILEGFRNVSALWPREPRQAWKLVAELVGSPLADLGTSKGSEESSIRNSR